ncbi:MAG: hypothetical protein IPN15_11720 [Saprospiraceae bacterium]|nr:hypothetical protein [Candidatus Vicinibacter affinis]
MKQFFPILVLVTGLYTEALGQWGVQIQGERHVVSTIPSVSSSEIGSDFFGVFGGVNYFFRLKNYRLEFLPGAGLAYESGKFPLIQSAKLNFKSIGPQIFSLINIYPFDFKNDCNCPTFKKEGNTLKKGLHLIIDLGFRYNIRNYVDQEQKTGQFYTGFGIGNDFGISENLTISPMILYNFGHLDKHLDSESYPEFSHQKISLGVRLLYDKNKGRKRRY